MRQKLILRGFPLEEADRVCAALVEKGLVDDLRYATLWTEARLRRNKSRLKRKNETPRDLCAKLQAKGIDGSIVRKALETVLKQHHI